MFTLLRRLVTRPVHFENIFIPAHSSRLPVLVLSVSTTKAGAPSLTQFYRGKGGKPQKPAVGLKRTTPGNVFDE
jgi:hypothetical protein